MLQVYRNQSSICLIILKQGYFTYICFRLLWYYPRVHDKQAMMKVFVLSLKRIGCYQPNKRLRLSQICASRYFAGHISSLLTSKCDFGKLGELRSSKKLLF